MINKLDMVVLLPLKHFHQSSRRTAAVVQFCKTGSGGIRFWCERRMFLFPASTRMWDHTLHCCHPCGLSLNQQRRRHLTYFEPLPKPGGRGDWPKADPFNELMHMEMGSFQPRHYQKAKNALDRFLQQRIKAQGEANDMIQLLERLLEESTLSAGHVRFSFFAHPPYLNAILTKWKDAFVTLDAVPAVANDNHNNTDHHHEDDDSSSTSSSVTMISPIMVLQLFETIAVHFPENRMNITALGIILEAHARSTTTASASSLSSTQVWDRVIAFTRQELETTSNTPEEDGSSSSSNATTTPNDVAAVDGNNNNNNTTGME